ncbi:hypothetical protein K402DRAFT_458741 [Aulographum hederae CBS 113979]|uniref:UBX domain-containing protein 2 n=1 Tax=Aulographum hederae CBS 113979 TaxID=1176131 RepID=A0A6G1HGP1_9PEZI|nr:hypothetical protein K402DRAFT_458741 [Aulographum hederae CBS 113979]
MIHQGDLQSGIALAIQQAKLVTCFVRDESETSDLWEEDWLKNPDVATQLANNTVTLLIRAGSQEAGFLGAFCPLESVPAVVIIDKGRLVDHISSEVSQDDFKSRIRAALGSSIPDAPTTTAQDEEEIRSRESTEEFTPTEVKATPDTPMTDAPNQENKQEEEQPVVSTTESTTPSIRGTQPPVAAAGNIGARAVTNTEPKPSPSETKGKGRQTSPPAAPATSDTAHMNYAAQQRLRLQSARAERERILQRIEHDKAERRERERRRKEEAAAAAAEGNGGDIPNGSWNELGSKSVTGPSYTGTTTHCAIQIRLPPSAPIPTIRQTFPATASIAKDIRPWVKENLEGQKEVPYELKQILTPLPSRIITESDEKKTLKEAGLMPSATLILSMKGGAASAYAGSSGAESISASIRHTIMGLWMTVFGYIMALWGMVSTFLGLNHSPEQSSPQEPVRAGPRTGASRTAGDGGGEASGVDKKSAASGNVKMRTLADQRAEGNEAQFYNGNSLDFEPKKDDEDDEATKTK